MLDLKCFCSLKLSTERSDLLACPPKDQIYLRVQRLISILSISGLTQRANHIYLYFVQNPYDIEPQYLIK